MNLTMIFIIAIMVSIIIFDVYIISKKGKQQSISAYIIRGSKKYPLMVLLLGIVLGHLFWSMDTFDWNDKATMAKRCRGFIGDGNAIK